jgi:hypothetical protein
LANEFENLESILCLVEICQHIGKTNTGIAVILVMGQYLHILVVSSDQEPILLPFDI